MASSGHRVAARVHDQARMPLGALICRELSDFELSESVACLHRRRSAVPSIRVLVQMVWLIERVGSGMRRLLVRFSTCFLVMLAYLTLAVAMGASLYRLLARGTVSTAWTTLQI